MGKNFLYEIGVDELKSTDIQIIIDFIFYYLCLSFVSL